jgi:hypothetical protein
MNKIIISYIIASALALGLLHRSLNKAESNIETLAEVLVHHADAIDSHTDALFQILEDLTVPYM